MNKTKRTIIDRAELQNLFWKCIRKTGISKILYKQLKAISFNKVLDGCDSDTALAELDRFCLNPKNSCLDEKIIGNEYDLEVIIPAYNVEKYIKQCLESVKSQKTQYSFHVTVIDDGSTDGTGDIIDSYKDLNNWTIIHQENQGPSGARNMGLNSSNAKYIMFVDADDLLCNSAIEQLLMVAFTEKADIVFGGYVNISQDGDKISTCLVQEGKLGPDYRLFGFNCGKAIVSTLFEKISFPVGYYFEDSIFAQIIHPLANEIYGVKDIVYQYRRNPTGITHAGVRSRKCIDSYWITPQLYSDRLALGLETNQAYYEYILRQVLLTYHRTFLMPEKIKQAVFVAWSSFINQEFNEYKTEDDSKRDLEFAIRNNRYLLYKSYCNCF